VMGADMTIHQAMVPFADRFPTWMWANEEFKSFILWLRDYNKALTNEFERVSIVGMDLYSLQTSIHDVITYLREHNAACATRVEEEYSCFNSGELDPQMYGMLVEMKLHKGCVDAAVNASLAIEKDHAVVVQPESSLEEADEAFIATMNAHVVQGAEQYYRSMFAPNANSWNVRDRHFMDQVHRVMEHLHSSRGQGFNRVAIWAHNSHVGNAHYTHLDKKAATMLTSKKRYQSGGGGGEKEHEFNIGQLAKTEYAEAALLVGQFTFSGTVACADDWGGPQRVKEVRPGLLNSMEEVLHTTSGAGSNLVINLTDPSTRNLPVLGAHRLQRAIGVIYRPDTERWSHYYPCDLSRQFDVVLWHDVTTAVCPLVL